MAGTTGSAWLVSRMFGRSSSASSAEERLQSVDYTAPKHEGLAKRRPTVAGSSLAQPPGYWIAMAGQTSQS
jgi:hypothetical protein